MAWLNLHSAEDEVAHYSAAVLEAKLRAELIARPNLNKALTFRKGVRKSSVKLAGSAEWTNVLLNLLLDVGFDAGFHVYPRRLYFARGRGRGARGTNSRFDRPKRTDDRSEWMVDACWTRYPDQKEWIQGIRDGTISKSSGLVLACESEWASGRFGSQTPEEHVSLVLDDFAKLVNLRASLKVLFFSFQLGAEGGVADFDDIVDLCERIATPCHEGEEYLLMGWPFTAAWSQVVSDLRSVTFPRNQSGAITYA